MDNVSLRTGGNFSDLRKYFFATRLNERDFWEKGEYVELLNKNPSRLNFICEALFDTQRSVVYHRILKRYIYVLERGHVARMNGYSCSLITR